MKTLLKRQRLFFILLFSLSILTATASIQAQTPPVVAFYYAWFDETTWTSGQPADLPLTFYRSADPAIIDQHIAQAKSAGITAFVQSWYGPQIENNQTETNFTILLDSAARHNFQAAVDFEVLSPFFADLGAVQHGLATLMATHIHHPAYLRYQGKPVIFFWGQQGFSVQQWAQMRAAIDPNHTTYWIAEGIDLSFQDVFDGHHLYSIAWSGNVQAELNKWPPRIQAVENRLGVDKLWVATVMPGYDDIRLGREDSFVRARQGGAFYRQTWNAAIATQPDLIVITSFNEWLEGTHIEPSQAYGDFYLRLTSELIKSPVPPSPAPPSPEEAPAPLAPELVPAAPVVESRPDVSLAETQDRSEFLRVKEEGATQVYTVQSGDTLWAIALEFGLSVDDIVAANNLDDPNKLRIGQALIMPNEAVIPADQAASETSETLTQIIRAHLPGLPIRSYLLQ